MRSAVFFVIVLCACAVMAAELPSGAAAGAAKTNAAAIDVPNGNARFYPEEVELGVQFKLLKELVAQHRQRAEEAARTNEPAKAKWEGDLAGELTERVSRTAAALEDVVRQRTSAWDAAKAAGAAVAPRAANGDEGAFLSRVDTQLWRLEQELKTALEASTGFAAQLQTNNSPEDVFRVSVQVEENNGVLRSLERERSLIELQKLQYHALKEAVRPK